jgi:4-hydroxyphenylpyruvate dioxygenase
VRYFDIEGKVTGVKSKAMTSPCGKIRIPINEEGSEVAGQIQEYLDAYHGEGIQHIALGTDDIYRTVDGLREAKISLLDTIDTYYELVDRRVPNHGEQLEELRKRKILIDGAPDDLLLQIFTENQIGPIFFEIIQRKGNQGFGEGNFKALFESIELDQIRRGVVQDKA